VTIDCRQLCDLVFEYVSGELSADRRELLEAHLKVCPPCVIYVETYRLTISLSRKLCCRSLSPECEKRLRDALARECREQTGQTE
jgi:anti-sigma factor RsiW